MALKKKKPILAIHRASRIALIAGASVLTACAVGRGAKPPRDVKVYSVQPDDSYCDPVAAWCQGKSGLVRKQAFEVLPIIDARGYYCVSPEDLKIIIETCPRDAKVTNDIFLAIAKLSK